MAQILDTVPESRQQTYFIILLVAIGSLAISEIDFLSVGGFGILYLHRVFIVMSVVYFLWVVFGQGRISLNRLDLTVLAFTFVICLRLIMDAFGPYPMTQSITITVQLLLAVAFYVSVASLPLTQERLKILLRVWVIVVFVVTIYGFYQTFARNFGLPLANITIGSFYTREANLFGFQRPTSLFKEPTHFSAFVLPSYVFLTYLFLKRQASTLLFSARKKNALVLVLCWSTFFMIASIGGYIALASTVCLVAVFDKRIRKLSLKIGGVVFIFFIIILLFGQEIEALYAPVYRITHFVTSLFGLLVSGSQVSGSIGVRLTRLYWAFVVWSNSVIFGVGINNIQYFTHLTEPVWYGGRPLRPFTHSVFGFVLSSSGLLGIVTYGAIYITAARYVRMITFNSKSDYERATAAAIGYAVFANVITSFFSLSIVNPLIWFLLALLSLLVTYSIELGSNRDSN